MMWMVLWNGLWRMWGWRFKIKVAARFTIKINLKHIAYCGNFAQYLMNIPALQALAKYTCYRPAIRNWRQVFLAPTTICCILHSTFHCYFVHGTLENIITQYSRTMTLFRRQAGPVSLFQITIWDDVSLVLYTIVFDWYTRHTVVWLTMMVISNYILWREWFWRISINFSPIGRWTLYAFENVARHFIMRAGKKIPHLLW